MLGSGAARLTARRSDNVETMRDRELYEKILDIAFDRFHIARHKGDAIDQGRRREHKKLKAETINPLTGTRYLWLQNPDRMELERLLQLDALKASCRKTARAWAIKELARSLWYYRSHRWALQAWLAASQRATALSLVMVVSEHTISPFV